LLKKLIYLLLLTSFTLHSQGQWTIYKTTNSGLPSNVVGEVAFDTNNIKWIATDQGLAKFDGASWTVYDTNNSPLPVPYVSGICIDNNNVIWIATYGGGVAKFDGVNWVIYDTLNSPLPANRTQFILLENNVKWIGTIRGLAKFDNNSWTVYNTTNSGIPSNFLQCGVIENNIKWIGTQSNGLAKYNDINWTVFTFQNSGLPSNDVTRITVDYLGNKWIATRFGGVAKFNSVINQWVVYNTTNSGLPSNNNNAILTQNHIKWIGSGWLAKFNDTSWTVFTPSNSPLPGTVIALSLDRTGRLWIGTDLGLAVYNTGIIGINNQNTNVPKSFELKQNYPNPFNPVTNIQFELSERSFVKLTVSNSLGQVVETLVNNELSPGIYNYDWNAANYSSGVYFYKLETGKFVDSKKMVLIK